MQKNLLIRSPINIGKSYSTHKVAVYSFSMTHAYVFVKTFMSLFSLGLNVLEEFLRPLIEKGLRSVMLFGVPTKCEKVSFHSRK
jgi:porphobilinogen synthase